jgi:hypothetical protein
MTPQNPQHLTVKSIWVSLTVIFTALVIGNHSLKQ